MSVSVSIAINTFDIRQEAMRMVSRQKCCHLVSMYNYIYIIVKHVLCRSVMHFNLSHVKCVNLEKTINLLGLVHTPHTTHTTHTRVTWQVCHCYTSKQIQLQCTANVSSVYLEEGETD